MAAPGGLFATVTATADAVHVADEAVRALDPADGSELWRFAPAERPTATAVAGGTVYAATEAGTVVALVAADGAERWRTAVAGEVVDLLPAGDAVYVGGERAGAVALDAADGAERWRAGSEPVGRVGPAVGDAVLAAGSDRRSVRSLSVADGSERWRLEPGGGALRPVAAGGRVVVATDGGLVYGLAP